MRLSISPAHGRLPRDRARFDRERFVYRRDFEADVSRSRGVFAPPIAQVTGTCVSRRNKRLLTACTVTCVCLDLVCPRSIPRLSSLSRRERKRERRSRADYRSKAAVYLTGSFLAGRPILRNFVILTLDTSSVPSGILTARNPRSELILRSIR